MLVLGEGVEEGRGEEGEGEGEELEVPYSPVLDGGV